MTRPEHTVMLERREAYVDALRGFAIAGVMITHVATATALSGSPKTLASIGDMGVPLFFVVSGFTIWASFARKQSTDRRPTSNFFLRRVFRLVPMYWFGIVLYTMVYGLGSRGWTPAPDAWHIPTHALLLNSLHPATPNTVVPGGWSISVEALFYLLVPALFALVTSTRRAVGLVLVGMAAIVYLHVLRDLLPANFGGATPQQIDAYWHRVMPNELAVFAFGILWFFLAQGKEIKLLDDKRRNLAALAVVAAGVILLAEAPVRELDRPPLYGALFLLLGCAMQRRHWTLLVNRATEWLGRISYSCYVLHFVVIKGAVHLLDSLVAPGSIGLFVATLVLTVPVTMLLGSITFRWIEQPAMNKAKALIRAREQRAEGRAMAFASN